jgi:hypothetical protein
MPRAVLQEESEEDARAEAIRISAARIKLFDFMGL